MEWVKREFVNEISALKILELLNEFSKTIPVMSVSSWSFVTHPPPWLHHCFCHFFVYWTNLKEFLCGVKIHLMAMSFYWFALLTMSHKSSNRLWQRNKLFHHRRMFFRVLCLEIIFTRLNFLRSEAKNSLSILMISENNVFWVKVLRRWRLCCKLKKQQTRKTKRRRKSLMH